MVILFVTIYIVPYWLSSAARAGTPAWQNGTNRLILCCCAIKHQSINSYYFVLMSILLLLQGLFGATNTTQASGGLFGSAQPAAATPAFGMGTFGTSTAFGNAAAQPAVCSMLLLSILYLFKNSVSTVYRK